jgi:protein involved in polysaccharide export with SLBB domain
MAGGLRDNAYREKATLARTQVVDGAHTEHTYVEVDLRSALAPASQNDFLLVNNDQLFVRSASNWHLPWTSTVSGRVKRPGIYAVREGETLDELLETAGGFLPDAFPRGLIFTRASVRAVEQERLEETRQRLSQDLMQLALASSTSNNMSSTSSKSNVQMATLQNLLSQAQNTQADGRVVIKLSDSAGHQRIASSRIILEDGDNITIPVRPMSVNVLGQVNNPTSILSERGWTTRDYLYRAGGPATNADLDNIMVIQADGTVITDAGLRNTGTGRFFPALPLISSGLMGVRLDAGDTVYVPEDVQSFVKLEHAKDMWTIFASAAQALGIVGLLATKL